MKVSGEARLSAPVAEVYAALQDPAVLVRTLPGCEQLEQTGPDSYRATISAGVAAIKGRFNGEVRLTDHEGPHAFTMHASGAGAPCTVNAVARVTLIEGEGCTLLRYDADATIGGVIGGVGQRMLTGVARKTAGEFFDAVDAVLSGAAGPAATVPAAASAGPRVGPGAAQAGPAGVAAPGGATAPAVWTAPAAAVDPARQRMRDLFVGAAFGAVVALLGVLVGAIVAGWS
jgi:carbon monoxide dehydrogenase subunit G